MKGWLVWRGQPVAKIHAIRLLVELAAGLEGGSDPRLDAAGRRNRSRGD